ncbi:MAG: tetratricopeptide repeat protein [Nitrospira sp.]|nr:tetratricopeptide repeat protein [Nitrospira sp.]
MFFEVNILVKIRNILIFLLIVLCSCVSQQKADNVQKAKAHYQLGVSYLNENKTQMAYVEFRKALELNPNDKDTLNALGLIYMSYEDYQKARESFTKAIAIDPNFPEAHLNLGVVYSGEGKWILAVDEFKAALKNPLYRTPDRAYYNLGKAYYRMGRFDDAIDAYKEAIKRSPDPYHAFYYGLALCYNAKGRYGEAASAMTRAIELDPFYRGNRSRAIEDLKSRSLTAKGEDKKDISDFLEILKY